MNLNAQTRALKYFYIISCDKLHINFNEMSSNFSNFYQLFDKTTIILLYDAYATSCLNQCMPSNRLSTIIKVLNSLKYSHLQFEGHYSSFFLKLNLKVTK